MNVTPFLDDACRTLLGASPTGALLCTPDATVAWTNAAACELLGLPKAWLDGKPIGEILGEAAAVAGPGVHRFVAVEGRPRRGFQCTVSTIDGAPGSTLWLLTDLHELEARRPGRAAVLAGIEPSRLDEVTGVLNRRTILQQLQSEISRTRRYGNPLSVVMVSLDDFQGADAETRRRVAGSLNDALRWVDAVGALAPDELLVVLPETVPEAAARVADKIRGSLDAGSPIGCRVASAGWSGDDDVDGLLDRLRAA